jgi:hypothetical protein
MKAKERISSQNEAGAQRRSALPSGPTAVLFWALLTASTGLQIYSLCFSGGAVHGDVRLYHRVAQLLWAEQLPYRDYQFEYPPYAVLCFLRLASLRAFQVGFGLQLLTVDVCVKLVIAVLAWRHCNPRFWLLPPCFLMLGTAANQGFYLQRLDVIPSAISVAALLAFWKSRYFLAGFLISLGLGCKLYPVLFALPLLLLARQKGEGMSFTFGLFVGLLPLLIAGAYLPWWRFLTFHAERGLQAESLYASLLWLAAFLHLIEANWAWVHAWFEVQSPINWLIVPVAQTLFGAAVFYAEVFVCWHIIRGPIPSLAQLARLLLIPLTAFVGFNLVLSPQFLFWMTGLAALAALEGDMLGPTLLTAAAVIIPAFYPSANYGTCFNLTEILALLARNLLVIVAPLVMVREVWRRTTMQATHDAVPVGALL